MASTIRLWNNVVYGIRDSPTTTAKNIVIKLMANHNKKFKSELSKLVTFLKKSYSQRLRLSNCSSLYKEDLLF